MSKKITMVLIAGLIILSGMSAAFVVGTQYDIKSIIGNGFKLIYKGTDNSTGNENMDINNEGIYAVNGHFFKSIYPMDEKSVVKAAEYINGIKNTYLTDNNKVFYAIIPDKTHYDNASGYSKVDYDKMMEIFNQNVSDMTYIELKDVLSLDDFYKSDNHWRQENLINAANRIGEKLGFKIHDSDFEKKSYIGFKGMYSKYSVSSTEVLQYLTSTQINSAVVDNYQNKNVTTIYETDKLATNNSYDVFLSGATPFQTITNSSVNNDKELVVFRDSFASSLTPLLVSQYSKITLIDTRFMVSMLINNFIEFDNQDVLFLYSSAIVNNSSILK